MLRLRVLMGVAIATLLPLMAGCGGRERPLTPPVATVQKLVLADDGHLSMQLRVQNFGPKPVGFGSIDARLELAGTKAGPLAVKIGFEIPGRSADVVEATLTPDATALAAIRKSLLPGPDGRAPVQVEYRIVGALMLEKPAQRVALDRAGTLSPVPGVPNEFR